MTLTLVGGKKRLNTTTALCRLFGVCNKYVLGLEFQVLFFEIVNPDSYLKGKGKYVLESQKNNQMMQINSL